MWQPDNPSDPVDSRPEDATRIEQSADWDHAYRALLPPLLEQVSQRDPGFGEEWTFEGRSKALTWDLTQPPLPPEAGEATSIGLKVVQALTRQIHGRLDHACREGTVFTIHFDVPEQPAPTAEEA